MQVEDLLPAKLCPVTLLSSGQCSQFVRFRLQQVQMGNKTSSFKQNLIAIKPNVNSNKAKASRGNSNSTF